MFNAIRRLLGYDDKFFTLLEGSAAEAQTSIALLVRLLRQPNHEPTLTEFIQTRQKHKRISESITEELCKTFVTPLEREDIEALSSALYKIPKMAEKFSERFALCRDQIQDVEFFRQTDIMEQTTATVLKMVQGLRKRSNLEDMKVLNDRMHYYEHEADKLMLELIKDLYGGRHDTLRVIIILDLYETIEKIIDRCRDVGNVIFQVVLKYS
ncbi:MAG: DUF47 family protein [Lentisphaerae bacterium]|nr:DUF47 family protein [Lentisphaerota bacterium]